jgi:hypothetical protein
MATWRLHRPLLIVELGTMLPFLIVCLLTPLPRTEIAKTAVLVAFCMGIAYVQLFEYFYHRLVAHRGVRFLRILKLSHLEHHRTFRGDRFSSRREEDLGHLAARWYLFPTTFAFHYLILRLLLPSGPLVGFLAGVTLHHALFEITHWFTHVRDNLFDRCLGRIPVLGRLRQLQVRHHRRHHETPKVNFNVLPPFLGDALAGTRVGTDAPSRRVSRAAPVAPRATETPSAAPRPTPLSVARERISLWGSQNSASLARSVPGTTAR